MITETQLKAIVPGIKAGTLTIYVPLLNQYMDKYEINTPARIAPFLANIIHESGAFRYTREIATGAAYEGRKDLGNVIAGDGMKYRGRGLIQITGRANYRWCSQEMYGDGRLVANPEFLELPDAATESACWFWTKAKKLNVIADKPDDWTKVFRKRIYNRFEWIVLLINGGQNGLAERKEFYELAKKAIVT